MSKQDEMDRRLRRYAATRNVIQAHKEHAEALAVVFDGYLRDYYGHPGDAGKSLGLASVLDDGRLVATNTESEPVLSVNHLYPHVQSTAASVVPAKPRALISPRRKGKTEEERAAIAAAGRVREALQHDINRKRRLHVTLRRAAAVTALMGHATLFAKWDQEKLLPKFEVLTPLEGWFDIAVKDWEDIRYFIRVAVLRKDEAILLARKAAETKNIDTPPDFAEQLEAIKYDSYPGWLSKHVLEAVEQTDGILDQFKWTISYDYYDFMENLFSKWVDGMDVPILEGPLPHAYVRNPATLIAFNDNLRTLAGIPDATLVAGMLAQQEELDTIGLHHARGTVPILFVNGSVVTNTDALLSAYRNARVNSAIVVDMDDAITDLKSALVWSQGPTLSPSVAEIRQRADQGIRATLAQPEYRRGVYGKAEVATEVALADAEVKTLQAPRAGAILDAIGWVADTSMRFYAERLPVDETLYARYGENFADVAEVSRETLRLPAFEMHETEEGEMVLSLADEYTDEYAYEAIPYSGNEGTRFAQLRLLEQWYPILAASPHVDHRALDALVTENLQHPELLGPKPAAAPAADQGLSPGLFGGEAAGVRPLPPGIRSGGKDTIETGALPADTLPVDAGVTALGGPGHSAPFRRS